MLNRNQIIVLPNSITKLHQLKELYLNNNQLTQLMKLGVFISLKLYT